MTKEWTNGPYRLGLERQILAPDGRTLGRAHLDAATRTEEECEANACLFAASWDMAEALDKLCSDDLRERLLDAQQDINFHADATMAQSVADASALIDELEEMMLAGLQALAKARGESA